jgi:soluble lytic murein transglycosylase-like protein
MGSAFGATQETSESTSIKQGFVKTVVKFETAIMKLNNNIDQKEATRLATIIAIESKKENIDPRIVLAILNTESSFNQAAVSLTGDISIAQINPRVWSVQRFKKKIGRDLNHKRLRKDEAYAISRMCLILSYLKKTFATKDKWWFARYHSSTPVYKSEYIGQLMISFRKLKPFGNTLLKDMPSLEHIATIRSRKNNEVALAGYGDK